MTKAISCESDIDVLYSTFVKTVQLATSICLPKPCFKGHIKPYWLTQLTTNHKSMTRARNKWVSNGRERDNKCASYSQYKSAKRDFRCVHRETVYDHHKSIENELNETAECDNNAFWRIINQRKRKPKKKTTVFDDVSCRTSEDINNGWKIYFQRLYSENTNEPNNDSFLQNIAPLVEKLKSISKMTDKSKMIILSQDVQNALKTCQNNKSYGYDSVYYKHMKHGGNILIV